MKSKLKIIILVCVLAILFILIYLLFIADKNQTPVFVKNELEKIAISTSEKSETSVDFLDNYDPSILDRLCGQAGYDYKPFLGKQVDFVSYYTDKVYLSGDTRHPLKVGIFSHNDQIVCVYFMNDIENDPSPLQPAVFPINDPSISEN